MMPVHIRWMIRADMEEVVRIEEDVYAWDAWSEEEFIKRLRQRNTIGEIAEHNDRVVGYTIRDLHKGRIHLVNIAVHRDFQRQGVATQLIDRLKSKLSVGRRNRITLRAHDANLASHLFFNAMGFRAASVERNHFNDGGDAYCFEYRVGRSCDDKVEIDLLVFED